MTKANLGIIGCSNRIDHLLGMLDDRANICAVCDLEQEKMNKFKQKYNPQAREYADYRELVVDPEIDWVAVASWNSAHADQAVAAMEAGKHVFMEKPVATSFDDCVRLQDAARRSNAKVMVGFTLRYGPHYRRIKELLDQGIIGDIVSFEFNETLDFNHGGHIMCNWRRKREFTGAHILEKCCHDIDQANWMVNSRAARVASFGGLDFFKPENAGHMKRLKKSSDGAVPYCAWPTAMGKNPFTSDKDIIDNQVGIIEFENGVRATFHTNINAGIPERRIYVLGTEGCLRGDFFSGKIEVRRIGFDEQIEDYSNEVITDGHGGADPVVVDYLMKMMYEDVPPLTTLKHGIESAVTCFALDEAMLKGEVVDMSPYWQQLD